MKQLLFIFIAGLCSLHCCAQHTWSFYVGHESKRNFRISEPVHSDSQQKLALADSLERPMYESGAEIGISKGLEKGSLSIGLRYAVDGFKTKKFTGVNAYNTPINSVGIMESYTEFRFYSFSMPIRFKLYPTNKNLFLHL